MKKVRRVLTDFSGETFSRTVWECRLKIGTNPASIGFLFEKPQEKIRTFYVKKAEGKYANPTPVYIDEISEDGLVFCSKM